MTDTKTGGQKGQKLAELGALDPAAILRVAEVAGYGGQKYARLNFMKGYRWSLSYDAMQRHLHLFWNGEETDPESGLPHLAHAGWHALCLLSFSERDLGTDDRYVNPHTTLQKAAEANTAILQETEMVLGVEQPVYNPSAKCKCIICNENRKIKAAGRPAESRWNNE